MKRNTISIVGSSLTSNGALNISANNDAFSMDFKDPIRIPHTAKNLTLTVQEVSLFNSVPNIVEGVNDKFCITCPSTLDVSTAYTLTVPEGLYDYNTLSTEIIELLETAGAKISPDPVISITANEATSRIEITPNYAGVFIDMTQPQTFGAVIGSDNILFGADAGVKISMPNRAQFNSVDFFLLRSDLVSKGVRVNGEYSNIICKIPVSAYPNAQIIYEPLNPDSIDTNNRIGSLIQHIRFWVTDHAGDTIVMPEEWSFRLQLTYEY